MVAAEVLTKYANIDLDVHRGSVVEFLPEARKLWRDGAKTRKKIAKALGLKKLKY